MHPQLNVGTGMIKSERVAFNLILSKDSLLDFVSDIILNAENGIRAYLWFCQESQEFFASQNVSGDY